MTTKQKWKLGTGIAGALLIIILIIQNREAMQTDVFFWTFTMSRSLLLIITLITGAALGFYAGKYGIRGRKPPRR